ncbi:uncharacterized protein N7503_004417 [Penicillium pulvis]|uniref:uncharacterized protein n=1 Tax=Penicillium pulvis TaxID=1562058 RepID=UPI002549A6D5|nr:uncharacterized protein N7503_004417 [Penicillium pulvis]KAJ5801967.1 hypothetical protein N7503_004417 [Penicillium pulvis]
MKLACFDVLALLYEFITISLAENVEQLPLEVLEPWKKAHNVNIIFMESDVLSFYAVTVRGHERI